MLNKHVKIWQKELQLKFVYLRIMNCVVDMAHYIYSIKMQHYLNLMMSLWNVHKNNVLVTDSLAYLNSFLGLDVYNEQPVQQRLCDVNELVLHIDS